jgi:acetoin utilization deacetylase AcuC-like enzyme
MSTFIYTHTDCLQHVPGPGHPESPARLKAVVDALQAARLDGVHWRDAPLGTAEQVLLIHTPAYLDWVESLRPQDGTQALEAATRSSLRAVGRP